MADGEEEKWREMLATLCEAAVLATGATKRQRVDAVGDSLSVRRGRLREEVMADWLLTDYLVIMRYSCFLQLRPWGEMLCDVLDWPMYESDCSV